MHFISKWLCWSQDHSFLTVISIAAAVVLIWNGDVLIFTSVLTARQQNYGLHPVKGMRDGNL